jgi:hypothetical protein
MGEISATADLLGNRDDDDDLIKLWLENHLYF